MKGLTGLILSILLCGCGAVTEVKAPASPTAPAVKTAEDDQTPEPAAEHELVPKFKDIITRHRKTAGDDTEKEFLALFDNYPAEFNDYIKSLSDDDRTISLKLASSETIYKKVILLPSQKPKAGKMVIQTQGDIRIVLNTEDIASIWFSGFPSSSVQEAVAEGPRPLEITIPEGVVIATEEQKAFVANLKKIGKGMAKNEVMAILGAPSSVRKNELIYSIAESPVEGGYFITTVIRFFESRLIDIEISGGHILTKTTE